MRGHAPYRLGDLRLGIGTGAADQLDENLERAQETLGPAALVGEFARHLPPALPFPADEPVGRHEDAVEDNLVKIVVAGEVDDRPDRDARRFEVEDQLAETAVTVRLGR